LEKFDLQLFADEELSETVVDDDVNEPDEEELLDEEEFKEEFAEAFEEEKEAEEESGDEKTEEEKKEEEPEPEPEEREEEKEEKTTKVEFTPEQQEKINQIVQERLMRDRQRRGEQQHQELVEKVQALEQATGMSIDGIIDHVYRSQVKQKAEEMGITEEEAREIIENQQRVYQTEQRLAQLEEQLRRAEENQLIQQRMNQYIQDRAKHINDPLVKKYIKEIDEFAGNGAALDFEPAMAYILGQKLKSGELLEEIRKGTEQKTLANVKKRSKASPEPGSQGGVSSLGSLTRQEKLLAAQLGISEKEWLEEKNKIKKKQ